ncbi:MAG TPA: thioredoxin domain-containing protein [Bacteroidia bacterium]|jgi:thioredoxin 1|nr:thioredoxin domain-containing protein [Bacteroidia bacterium]
MKKIFLISFLFFLIGEIPAQDKSNKKARVDETPKSISETISVDEFQKKLAEKDIQIIDVRTPEEYNEGYLKGALNINYKANDFASEIAKLDKSKPTLIYCLGGGRSAGAAEQMKKTGFTTIYNMQGGMIKWNAANKPVEYPSSALDKEKPGMTLAEYNKIVTGEKDKYILVDFTAKWCGPCQKMMPMLHKISEEKKPKLTLIKIDADENKSLLKEKGITGIPVLELYFNGKLVWKRVGYIGEEEFLSETGL